MNTLNKRVLIVDESLTVRMDLAAAFEDSGFAAVACADARSAGQSLDGDRFDLVVIEPGALGDSFAAFVRTVKAAAMPPVVVLLGTGNQHELRDCGADLFLEKPCDSDWVVAQARKLLAGEDGQQQILLIDDSPTYLHELGEALRAAGYEVLTAETGEEGLTAAFETNPTAIIVDNVLPGIDGPAVLRRLRQNPATRRTPCVLLTASEDRRQELRALEAGADTFVRKSQDLDVVLASLSAVLRSASAPAAWEFDARHIGKRKVMVADPDLEFASAISVSLQEEGYDATVCPPDQLGQAIHSRVDVIVVGSGYSEAHRIASTIKSSPQTQNTRVIVVGDSEERGTIVSFLNSGVDDYLLKSSGRDVLAARVRAQIRRKQVEDENRDIQQRMLRRELEARAQREIAIAGALQAEELRKAKELAEDKAREAAHAVAQNEAVFTSLSEGIIICDLGGIVVYINDAALRIFRMEREEILAHHLSRFAEVYEARFPDGRIMSMEERPAGRVLAGDALQGLEAYLCRADLDYRWIGSFNIAPVKTPDGRRILGAMTIRDITAQKKAEDILLRSEKLAATGRLAASIAHEINNPLAAVTNLLFLLEGKLQDDAAASGYLALAQREVQRITHIAKQTLAFYRDTADPVNVNLCDLVQEVLEVYSVKAQSAEISLVPELDGACAIKGFPGELRQVISNLVVNAIDASPRGAKVRVRVRAGFDWADNGKPGMRITIGNGGPGIPVHLRSELFKPFFTTKGNRGTGLGLWLSSSIVEKHRGRIRFRSSTRPENSGTSFSIIFPFGADVRADFREDVGKLFQAVGRELLNDV